MRLFWNDLFILACIYLDIGLVFFLMDISLHPLQNFVGLIVVPIGFFVISGSALVAKRLITESQDDKPSRREKVAGLGPKGKKSRTSKKDVKPQQASKTRVEFGFHACPKHGEEKCAGSYSNLHSCNGAMQPSTKQVYWKEETPSLPAKIETR